MNIALILAALSRASKGSWGGGVWHEALLFASDLDVWLVCVRFLTEDKITLAVTNTQINSFDFSVIFAVSVGFPK